MMRTERDYKELIDNGSTLAEIPTPYHTFSLCKYAIARNTASFEQVEWNNFSVIEFLELLSTAITAHRRNNNGNCFRFDIFSMNNLYLLEQSILRKAAVFEFCSIPEDYDYSCDYADNIRRICKTAIRLRPKYFRFLPAPLKEDRDLCIFAIGVDDSLLRFMSPNMIDYEEICNYACTIDYRNLKFVSHEISIYGDICEEAIEDNPLNLKYISHLFDGYSELCIAAVRSNPSCLEFVYSDVNKYYEICEVALEKMPSCLKYVDENAQCAPILYKNFSYSAVHERPDTIRYIPQEYHTAEICEKAVNAHPCNLRFVARQFWTEVMCRKFLDECGLYPIFHDLINNELTNDENISIPERIKLSDLALLIERYFELPNGCIFFRRTRNNSRRKPARAKFKMNTTFGRMIADTTPI